MAELADARDLGSSEETRTGSIPARCTKNVENGPIFWTNLLKNWYHKERGFLL